MSVLCDGEVVADSEDEENSLVLQMDFNGLPIVVLPSRHSDFNRSVFCSTNNLA
jgi:hypothetical protein